MAVAAALALAVAIGVPVALSIALPLGLALAVALIIAGAFALTVAVAVGLALAMALALTSGALELTSLSRALLTPGVALLLALLLPVGVVLSLPVLLRGLLALLGGEALWRTRPDRVAVAEVRRQRSLGDGDRHERVLLGVGVVTDRHLRVRVLGRLRRGMRERDESRRVAGGSQGRERAYRESGGGDGRDARAS